MCLCRFSGHQRHHESIGTASGSRPKKDTQTSQELTNESNYLKTKLIGQELTNHWTVTKVRVTENLTKRSSL